MRLRILPGLFLGALLSLTGCQQMGLTPRAVTAIAGAPVVSQAEHVHYAPGHDGPRRVLRIARLLVREGDELAPPARVPDGPVAAEDVEEVRHLERESPARVLPESFLDAREEALAEVLRHPVELIPAVGQEVTVEKLRDFVYAKNFRPRGAGWLRRTLSTETLGYQMRMTWHEDAEDASRIRLDVEYWGREVATYDKTADGQSLPVFDRESLRGAFQLGSGEALVFGSRRPEGEEASEERSGGLSRVFGQKRPWLERWIVWFSGDPVDSEAEPAPEMGE